MAHGCSHAFPPFATETHAPQPSTGPRYDTSHASIPPPFPPVLPDSIHTITTYRKAMEEKEEEEEEEEEKEEEDVRKNAR
jgi:hypothetical protein